MLKNTSDFGGKSTPQIIPNYHESDERYYSKEELALKPVQWGMFALNQYKAISITHKQLPSGIYTLTKDERDNMVVFVKKNTVHDNLIELTGIPNQIAKEIDEFWGKEDKFKEVGFLHRRGYLIYGAHGVGKSSLIHQIVDSLIKVGGIVFYCNDPKLFNDALNAFRQVEPTRKIVCIFEDIDAIIKKFGESDLLSLLDGENQISGVVNLATTNYPELLDKRIVGRPRRFDRVYKIENMTEKGRMDFLKKKLPKGQNFKEWTKKTKNLSIAGISEAIISVLCFNKTIDEAVDIMETLAKNKSSDDGDAPIGFEKEDND